MNTAVFSTRKYDRKYFDQSNKAFGHTLTYFEHALREESAQLASTYDCVCAFVNDRLNRDTLEQLAHGNTRLIAMRCAGYNNVDVEAAADLGITLVRVPAYSPHAVSEHVIAILMALYRTRVMPSSAPANMTGNTLTSPIRPLGTPSLTLNMHCVKSPRN